MSENEWVLLKESLREIKDALIDLNSKLDKRAEYLMARAEANKTDIERHKTEMIHVNTKMKELSDGLVLTVDRVDGLELTNENMVKKSECNNTRSECQNARMKSRETCRNWILVAFAAANVILVAVTVFDKVFR
jgi:hypothetical protein